MVAIKPHHFVDIITVFGSGPVDLRPHPYGHAVHLVTERILGDRDVLLRMELGAGDISDIYRENPPDRVKERLTNLQKGIAKFLA